MIIRVALTGSTFAVYLMGHASATEWRDAPRIGFHGLGRCGSEFGKSAAPLQPVCVCPSAPIGISIFLMIQASQSEVQ